MLAAGRRDLRGRVSQTESEPERGSQNRSLGWLARITATRIGCRRAGASASPVDRRETTPNSIVPPTSPLHSALPNTSRSLFRTTARRACPIRRRAQGERPGGRKVMFGCPAVRHERRRRQQRPLKMCRRRDVTLVPLTAESVRLDLGAHRHAQQVGPQHDFVSVAFGL